MDRHTAKPAGRVRSLDALRGATMVLMILVNNPGTWAAVYPPLLHAEWHGWTPTDLVFPFFLFCVGAAISLALGGRLERGTDRVALLRKIALRAGLLFAIGVGMAAYGVFVMRPESATGDPSWSQVRIMGVLQRIGLCYLAAAALFVFAPARVRWIVAGGLLVGYAALLQLVPVPGVGPPTVDVAADTIVAWFDRAVLGTGHLWGGAGYQWDPEGLLSTLPSIATTLVGVEAGVLLRARGGSTASVRLFALGAVCTVLGLVWSVWLPINKPIWTSSYALFTAGAACALLGVMHAAIDVRGWRRWSTPLVTYGKNALLVFVGSGLVARTLYNLPAPGEATGSLQAWLFRGGFGWIEPRELSSLTYAVVWVLGWYAILRTLEKRGIVWKV